MKHSVNPFALHSDDLRQETVILSPGIAWLISQASLSYKIHPEGIHFPSGIFMCNILAAAIAYIIERSKTA